MFDDFLRDWYARHDRAVRGVRPADGLRRVRRRQAAPGRRAVLPRVARDRPADGLAGRPAEDETVHGLGNRKNDLVLELIREQGVEPFEGSVRFAQQVARPGAAPAGRLLEHELPSGAIAGGDRASLRGPHRRHRGGARGLAGKPAPDTFLAGAKALGAEPAAAVFEDALAGVEAGRAGDFGWVVGVDRSGQAEAMKRRVASQARFIPSRLHADFRAVFTDRAVWKPDPDAQTISRLLQRATATSRPLIFEDGRFGRWIHPGIVTLDQGNFRAMTSGLGKTVDCRWSINGVALAQGNRHDRC